MTLGYFTGISLFGHNTFLILKFFLIDPVLSEHQGAVNFFFSIAVPQIKAKRKGDGIVSIRYYY